MLRIKEALQMAQSKGKKITRMDIANALWGKSKEETKIVNISNLFRGKTKRFEIEWITKICDLTGVDANFLFKKDQ